MTVRTQHLSDPAAFGAALFACREASGEPTLHILPQAYRGVVRWRIASAKGVLRGEYATEAEALGEAMRRFGVSP